MARTVSGYERELVHSAYPVRERFEQSTQRLLGALQRPRTARIAAMLNVLVLTGLMLHVLRLHLLPSVGRDATTEGLLALVALIGLAASLFLTRFFARAATAGHDAADTPSRQPVSASPSRLAEDDAERRVRELMAQMGHELRTPLNAIIGFSDMMHQELLGPLGTTRYRSYAADIRNSGVALLEAVEDTLTLTHSMAEPGGRAVTASLLHEVVDEAMARTADDARGRNLTFDVVEMQSIPRALPNVLQQVLVHILRSAVQATERGGRITIDAGRDAAYAAGSLIRVHVPQPEHLVPDAPRSDRPLAIAIARTLVELQGGWLDVRHERNGTLAYEIGLAG